MLSPENVRLAALAGTLFVVSYGGVAWVMAGTPVPGAPEAPPVRVAALPASTPNFVTSPRSVAPAQPRPVDPAVSSGDGNPQRDKLRVAALQASAAYALTPCDEAAKAVMIQAVSSYARAWADMMGCGPDGCDYRKINATAATFSTPLDIQVRDAIGVAFDKRGISVEDFPAPLRINVAMLVRGRGAPATACPQSRAQVVR